MLRTSLFALVALTCLAGCGRSTDPVATTPETLEPPLVQAYVQDDNTMSVAGLWNFTMDPSTLEATLEPIQLRAGSQTDDTYALSLDKFFNPHTVTLSTVKNVGSAIALTFEIAHPFPAPSDPTAPPTGFGNRADLGFSGIFAVLGDVPSATGNTYFTDRVVNTEIMANPHGYFSPEGLLPLSLTANTFPYRLVVHDENGGNRIGIDNGGNPRGNFGADGWTRAELGANRTGWTGYNVLHQGQRSSVEWEMTRAYIASHSPVALTLAIIAKYNDPRGGTTPDEKLANRLPPASPDVSLFSYRMPHGTWDIPRVIVRPESGGFEVDTESSSTISVSIEDWDIFSTETTEADLSLESDPRKVNVGAAGFPLMDVCIPGVLGDATVFQSFTPAADRVDDDSAYPDGDVGPDTGLPGDLVLVEHLITKPAGTGQTAGPHRALFRALDLEDSAFGIPLDPGLVVLTDDQPEPTTYGAFSVTVSDPSTGTGWAQLVGDESYSEALAVEIDDVGNVYVGGQFEGPTDFGGGTRTAAGAYDSFIVSFDPTGAYRWDRTWGNADGDQINDLALIGPTQTTLVALGGFTGNIDVGTGLLPSYGQFDLLLVNVDTAFGTTTSASAQGGVNSDSPAFIDVDLTNRIILSGYSEGAARIFGTDFTTAGYDPWIVRGPLTMDSTDMVQTVHSDGFPQLTAITVDGNNDVIATGTSTGPTTIDSTLYDLPPSSGNHWIDKLVADGHAEWVKLVRDFEEAGTVRPSSVAVSRDALRRVFVAGEASNATIDFGGGPHVVPPEDISEPFIVQFNTDGTWFSETWYGESPYFEYIKNLRAMTNGNVVACGGYENTINLGGGVRPTHNPGGDTMFLFRTTGSGSFVWDALWDGGGQFPQFTEMATNEAGAIVLIGSITGELDGNPGVNVMTLTPVASRQSMVISLPGTPGW